MGEQIGVGCARPAGGPGMDAAVYDFDRRKPVRSGKYRVPEHVTGIILESISDGVFTVFSPRRSE